jgi:predicted nucleic acid-binding protein
LIVLLDNNVVIDAIARRKPFNCNAEKIFEAAGNELFQGCITSNSVTDIYYITRKLLDPAAAREKLFHLFNLFEVVTVTGEDCEDALWLPMNDYEDALIALCARKINADYLVTSDQGPQDGDFIKAASSEAVKRDISTEVIDPAGLLSLLGLSGSEKD